MFTSFSAALTALTANEVGVDVVGSNLANLNTTGYKSSVVSFYDLVSQSLGLGGGTPVGLGTGRPRTVHEFTQGAIQVTTGALDGAIQGEDFSWCATPRRARSVTRALEIFRWTRTAISSPQPVNESKAGRKP